MSVFDLITLFGGLAMFLYGMRMMGDGLKESSSGALKKVMENLTGAPWKAFLLGLVMTAVIQSSTATIVITAGLVGAGVISLKNSLGIIIGANVGTTVTGQIIRLLDVDASGASILQFFKPSTLAPLALIVGIIFIMGKLFKGADKAGQILIGFGILFSGLLNMTAAVNVLQETGIIESLFSRLGESPVLGYIIGAGVAFVLQSSSASIGILQAFSTSGQLTFSAIYAVLVGIYLGDCVTTAIVCNIGAKPDAKRVGMVNILFNLSKTAAVLVVVNIIHSLGWLDPLWSSTIDSGGIANTNTIFNLVCAITMLPLLPLYYRLSHVIVRDAKGSKQPEAAQPSTLDALNPVFIATPALAFGRCYDAMLEMFELARENVKRGFQVIDRYDEDILAQMEADEERIDMMTDRVSNYLIQLSAKLTQPQHLEILNHYYSVIGEFEHLGDHAMCMAKIARNMHRNDLKFSKRAVSGLNVLHELLARILDYTDSAFRQCDLNAAHHIEPLEEVVDDMVSALKDKHLSRLREGTCTVVAGTEYLNLLAELERISDVCSNVGVATVVRATPSLQHKVHDYVSQLHSGTNAAFNREYQEARDRYFRLLKAAE